MRPLLTLLLLCILFNQGATQCTPADGCEDITSALTLSPITLDTFAYNYICLESCLDNATPELSSLTCGFDNQPTVWIKLDIDDAADFLFTTVTPHGMWDPIWAVFRGNDCDNLSIVMSDGLPACNEDDGTPDLHQSPIESSNDSYYIAITAKDATLLDGEIDNGAFDVCVSTISEVIVCIGDIDNSFSDPEFNMEVINRSCGGDLDGPFYPGEEVIIDISFQYDASESGADWLSGIIPTFGEGWDLEGIFENSEFHPYGNGQQAQWYEKGGPCAPVLQEDLEHLCTYIDANGEFQICNALDENCPCELGMSEGDILPSGWFWVTTGGTAGCENDCSPGEGWGIGTTTANINQTLVLRVREFKNEEECFVKKDLQIAYQTFSDAVTGCWQDPVGECTIDRKQFGPKWEVDCNALDMVCEFYKVVHDVYFDINQNGVHDSIEPDYRNASLFVEPNDDFYYDNEFGLQRILLSEGIYDISFYQESAPGWSVIGEDTLTVSLNADNPCDTVGFGLFPDNPIHDISTHIILPFPRCNSTSHIGIAIPNDGHFIESGTAWITVDTNVTVSWDTAPDFIVDNAYGWNFENLVPGSTIYFTGDAEIPGPPEFAVGESIYLNAYINTLDDNGAEITVGESELTQVVQCSYDPNDKLVNPSPENGYTYIGQEKLVYTVRFQNTGNAEAINITILDTLSEYVIPSSFRYIDSSHPDKLTTRRTLGNIMDFTFTNILLPDSTTSPTLSQGYVTFSVDILPGLEEGTVIENTASIYFDENPPIVTNTIKNILYDDKDSDGSLSIMDCDDENSEINPSATEIPNNSIDEDCDGIALIIDDDMDGFNSDEDCDDSNASINPDADEIINNEIDEDCDGLAVIIDNDQDGFNSDEDCNDQNPDINPDAEEIPDNGIDEDCDGQDEISINTENHNPFGLDIYPNPTIGQLNISYDGSKSLTCTMLDINGSVLLKTALIDVLDISTFESGVYILAIQDADGNRSAHRLIKL